MDAFRARGYPMIVKSNFIMNNNFFNLRETRNVFIEFVLFTRNL